MYIDRVFPQPLPQQPQHKPDDEDVVLVESELFDRSSPRKRPHLSDQPPLRSYRHRFVSSREEVLKNINDLRAALQKGYKKAEQEQLIDAVLLIAKTLQTQRKKAQRKARRLFL
jgi:hypothetical protein